MQQYKLYKTHQLSFAKHVLLKYIYAKIRNEELYFSFFLFIKSNLISIIQILCTTKTFKMNIINIKKLKHQN